MLRLPADWTPGVSYPVIFENPGNDWRSDKSRYHGTPKSCSLGFGLTAGSGYIWVALSFLGCTEEGRKIAQT